MSQVKVQGDPSGTGIFTIASPNSNSNVTLTLPTTTGTVQVSGAPISGTTGTFTGLVDISAAGAGQIKFPATQNASSNANTLDDYEEGTWTPIDGSGAGLTLSVGAAAYTRVGRIVHAQFAVQYPSNSNGTRAMIGGLPFSCLNVSLSNYGGALGYTDCNISFGTHVDPGLTKFELYRINGGDVTNADMSSRSLRMVITYFTET